MKLNLLFLILFVSSISALAAGCFSSPADDGEPVEGSVVEVRLTASSFPEGADWILIETRSDGGGPTLRNEAFWREHEGDVTQVGGIQEPQRQSCVAIYASSAGGGGSHIRGWSPGGPDGFSTNIGGTPIGLSWNVTAITWGFDITFPGPRTSSDGRSYYLIAHSLILDPWPGDSFEWTLRHASPFTWQVISSGTTECGHSPEDFDEGEFVTTRTTLIGAWSADGLRKKVHTESGALLAFGVAANIAFDAFVSGDGTSAWSGSHSGELSRWEFASTVMFVPAGGDWTLGVDGLRSSSRDTATVFMVIDGIPPLVVEVFGAPGAFGESI